MVRGAGMPEGDTIFRTAARLRHDLQAKAIVRAEARQPDLDADSLVGHGIDSVEARGKHLLMHLGDGRSVHSHMGMTGSWHVYAEGQAWQKPQRRAALVMHAASGDGLRPPAAGNGTHRPHDERRMIVAVCFNPKTLEVLTADALRRHPYLRRLGPDLLAHKFACEDVMRRFRIHDVTPIGEALMNQTILSGIGNVYKSETLFAVRCNPFVPVGKLSDVQIATIVKTARELMLRNLSGYPRRTRFAADGRRLWVYNRSGERCMVCGASIRMRRQGDLGRSTYWCPDCQAVSQ